MRWLCLFLFVLFLEAKPLEIEVSARAALLMNAETGAVLYEKSGYAPAYPASLTKVATALYILEKKPEDLSSLAEVTEECLRLRSFQNGSLSSLYGLEKEGSTMGLKLGEKVSLDALLHGLLLSSGNDAANTLAQFFAPSIPHFMEELNEYLISIGCRDTSFVNPHGLHAEEHCTTAFDLAWMTKRALRLPRFREIVGKVSYLKPKTNKQPPIELKQTNPLIKPGPHFYRKALGGKTGYTSAALYSFIGAAEQEGRTLIAVVLGAPNRKSRYEDAVRMFEAAFAEEKKTVAYFGPEHLFSRQVEGGTRVLQARLHHPVFVSFYPAEEPECRGFVRWEAPVFPVKKGAPVGQVEILDAEGALLASETLFAEEEVQETLVHQIKRWLGI